MQTQHLVLLVRVLFRLLVALAVCEESQTSEGAVSTSLGCTLADHIVDLDDDRVRSQDLFGDDLDLDSVGLSFVSLPRERVFARQFLVRPHKHPSKASVGVAHQHSVRHILNPSGEEGFLLFTGLEGVSAQIHLHRVPLNHLAEIQTELLVGDLVVELPLEEQNLLAERIVPKEVDRLVG